MQDMSYSFKEKNIEQMSSLILCIYYCNMITLNLQQTSKKSKSTDVKLMEILQRKNMALELSYVTTK